ncbi:MAG: hypothetical protein AAF927_08170, partial [Bacteroidota bacterium]
MKRKKGKKNHLRLLLILVIVSAYSHTFSSDFTLNDKDSNTESSSLELESLELFKEESKLEIVSNGSQIELPVTFDNDTIDYTLDDFGGNYSSVVLDPLDPSNMVGMTTKSISAEIWSGTVIGTPLGFASPIPFSASESKMSVRIYSPSAGLPIRLKVEDASDNTIFVEAGTFTTTANAWETLVFDFNTPIPGTGPLDLNNTYDLASISFNYGVTGAAAGADTIFFWDDVRFLSQMELPLTFEDPNMEYSFSDFGGNYSNLGVDPMDPT